MHIKVLRIKPSCRVKVNRFGRLDASQSLDRCFQQWLAVLPMRVISRESGADATTDASYSHSFQVAIVLKSGRHSHRLDYLLHYRYRIFVWMPYNIH